MARRTVRMLVAIGALGLLMAVVAQGAPIAFVADGNKDIGDPDNARAQASADPAAAGSYSVVGNVHTVTGGGGDWWGGGEMAHIAYTSTSGDFRIESEIAWQGNPVNSWAKAGLFMRNDLNTATDEAGGEKEVNALMAFVDPNNTVAASLQWRDTPTSGMGDSSWKDDDSGANPVQKVAIQRREVATGLYLVEGFADTGSGWFKVAGHTYTEMADTIYTGLAVTGHQNLYNIPDDDPDAGDVPWTETADFTAPVFTDPVNVLGLDTAMRPIGVALPYGGQGYWGVREVLADQDDTHAVHFKDQPNNLEQAIAVIEAGGGTAGAVEDYQASFLNIHDSSGQGHVTYWQSNYGLVDAGHKAKGSLDRAALVANGRIAIPVTGWYTFDVNSDDGFELAIDGTIVQEANYGKGTSDVLGQAYLEAGEHDIRVLHWEGDGGAAIEVLAAPGYKTGYDATFVPIGQPAVAAQDYPDTPDVDSNGGASAGWDVVTIYNPSAGNLDAAISNVEGYWAGTLTPTTFGTAVADYIAYNDPDDGGGKQPFLGNGDYNPFPGEVSGTAENSFAAGARGTMHLDAAATITFVTYSDDGVRFRLVGADDGDWIDRGSTKAGDFTTLAEGFKFTSWNADCWATIALDAGDYDLELMYQEGGGGAHVVLYAFYGEWGEPDASDWFLLGAEGLNVDTEAIAAGLELVPEPATLALLGIGGMCVAVFRRRR